MMVASVASSRGLVSRDMFLLLQSLVQQWLQQRERERERERVGGLECGLLYSLTEVGISFVHIDQEKLCAAPGPGVVSVNLALHLVCSFTSSSVSEWSVCEVCLS